MENIKEHELNVYYKVLRAVNLFCQQHKDSSANIQVSCHVIQDNIKMQQEKPPDSTKKHMFFTPAMLILFASS
jgi:hypothetical protein